MKPSTYYLIISALSLPLQALLVWWVWNNIIASTFQLPQLEYWHMLLIIPSMNCLIGTGITYYLGKILDHLTGHD